VGNRFPTNTILKQQIEISGKETFALQLIFFGVIFYYFRGVFLVCSINDTKIGTIQFGFLSYCIETVKEI
jgi:hypothetical protein